MAETSVTPPKPPVDWERIEAEYRAGVLSLREIAALHPGTNHVAIKRRADRYVWDRAHPEKKIVRLEPEADKPVAGFIYAIFIDAPERFYKIGMAARFDARFDQHQCASPFDIGVACAYFVGDMRAEERALHEKFTDKRVRGEWFRLNEADVREIAQRGILI